MLGLYLAAAGCAPFRRRPVRRRLRRRPASAPLCAGLAQPLAQPETWRSSEPSRMSRMRGGDLAAMARAAIWPEAQAGAPGQAAMRARGSAGVDDEAEPAGGLRGARRPAASDGQSSSRARRAPGGFRMRRASRPARRNRSVLGIGMWPKGRATPRAKRPSVSGRIEGVEDSALDGAPLCLPDISHGRGARRCMRSPVGAARAASRPAPPCGGDVRQDRGGRASANLRRDRQLPLRANPVQARDRFAAMPRSPQRMPRASSRQDAKRRRASRIAGDGSRHGPPRHARRRQPDIGRHRIQPEWPPPSTTTDTFGPSLRSSPAAAMRFANALGQRRAGRRSPRGSRPASGPVSTGTPVRTAMPSASTSRGQQRAPIAPSARGSAGCRAPVTSTMPLPCRSAALQSPIKRAWAKVLQQPD